MSSNHQQPSEQGHLMSVRKFSGYSPSARLSSDCFLVSITLCSAGTFLARCKEGQISFHSLSERATADVCSQDRKEELCLARGQWFFGCLQHRFLNCHPFFGTLMLLFGNLVSFCPPLGEFANCFSLGVATVHFPADVFRDQQRHKGCVC